MSCIKLTNLLPNGDFETGNFNNYGIYSIGPVITTEKAFSGTYSILGENTSTGSGTERCLTYNSKIALTSGHIYYYGMMQYLISGSCTMFYAQGYLSDFTNNTTLNQWVRNSKRAAATASVTPSDFRIGSSCYGAQVCKMYVDDLFFIDLTSSFGSGNEPTKEWCDTNIPLFTGTVYIDYDPLKLRVKYNNNYIINDLDISSTTKTLSCNSNIMASDIQLEIYGEE